MKFSNDHEWVEVNGSAAKIGITDYAQHSLGDIVFVELPKVGSKLTAGKAFGSVESVKAVSDLCAPISGTVTAVNDELESAPELINEDAFKNWIVEVEVSDANELGSLMSEEEYTEFCKKEA